MPYVLDSQAGNGAYTSGQVMFNAEYLASSSNYNDWSNAYIAMPYQIKLEGYDVAHSSPNACTGGTTTVNYLTAIKNNSLINSITVSQGGRNIIAGSTSLAHLVNYKMLSTFSQDDLHKNGPTLNFSPDTEDSFLHTAAAGTSNCDNVVNTTVLTRSSNVNSGMRYRQEQLWGTPNTVLETTDMQKTEVLPYQSVSAVPALATKLVYQDFSDIHFVAIIRLKDLSDYFDKHPKFTKGVGYQITLNVNQAVTIIDEGTATTTPFATIQDGSAVSTSLIGGSTCQPAMMCSGINTEAAAVTYTSGTFKFRLTAQIDTDSSNQRLSGIRLYVPNYELQSSTVEKIQRSIPTKEVTFMDYYTTRISSIGTLQSTSAQIASGLTNAKAIIIIPQAAASILTAAPETSPYDTVPGTTTPLLSLTNINIKLGSKFVLSDRVSYGFQQFIDNNNELFGLNGAQSPQTSGLINYSMFKNSYRYYCYDLSRIQKNQEEQPQMISIEATNNSAISIDLVVFVYYGRKVSYNMTAGGMTVD